MIAGILENPLILLFVVFAITAACGIDWLVGTRRDRNPRDW